MSDAILQSEPLVFEAKDLCISAENGGEAPKPILKNVNFKVRQGEVVALIGESGSGKTTLSLAALGYCKPGLFFDRGAALLDGEDVTRAAIKEVRNLRGIDVAYLAQNGSDTFNPSTILNSQVIESAVVHGVMNEADAGARALFLYKQMKLPNPEIIGMRYPHQVSGGQIQRLMAAMALCGKPKLLVLDEPTTALDVTTQIEVLKTLKTSIREEGASAIYVTHDLAVVAQVADHIVVLYDGMIKESGATDVIINNPAHPYTKKLIAANMHLSQPPEIGRDSEARITTPPLLKIEGVDAGYGKVVNGEPSVKVLKDISFSVPRGAAVGIIGESGSGKSTLARVIAGLLPAYKGEVMLGEERLPGAFKKRSIDQLKRVQLVYQLADKALNPRMRIRDILGRPLTLYFGKKGQDLSDRVDALLEMVELPADVAERYPRELSGGQKQRVNLARALAAEPDIVLCDEVTSALDTMVTQKIMQMLARLRDETGISFIFVSHDMANVAEFASKIIVLYAGHVVEEGTTREILSPPYHPYTRLLISSVPEMKTDWLERAVRSPDVIRAASAGSEEIPENGCPFFSRCTVAIDGVCDVQAPPRRAHGSGHIIACHQTLDCLDKPSNLVKV